MNTGPRPSAAPLVADVPDAEAAARRATELFKIRQRLDWLFRHAQPSVAMTTLREVVQRYREGDTP